ncbi:Longitudinals lacking protein-like [Orchesella cincta]|uniref:Longitudinals lacking protein-like n=1 Tax=Orchesella cincta TaxID=48709 RepID=A0A1D2NFU9_ORCCI|nr:Longitudinals lacking protein-like [Orchesella cincta]
MEEPVGIQVIRPTHALELRHAINQKLDQQQLVDVTLSCEGRQLKCHQVILAASSPFFAEVLQEMKATNPVIHLHGVKFWEVEAIVKFMYKGEITATHQNCEQLKKTAEKLQINGMAELIIGNSGATNYGVSAKPNAIMKMGTSSVQPKATKGSKKAVQKKSSVTTTASKFKTLGYDEIARMIKEEVVERKNFAK